MPVEGYLSGNGDAQEALVVVFLRGGADGLSLVVPLEDDEYYNARPRLAVTKSRAIRLDDFFGLNPLLRELDPLYREGALAIVHGAGSEDTSRSHFEAQDFMEHGGVVAGGWLGRFLRYRPEAKGGALSAISVGKEVPECLRGAPSATVLQSIQDFSFGAGSTALVGELERLYLAQEDTLSMAARDTLRALRRIETLRKTPYQPEHGMEYPADAFAQGLAQIARLIKARVGLEAASIDLDGWDSHFTQGSIIDPLMTRLAGGLAAFHRDLGKMMERVTVVAMTEFGRRVGENASFGTDHGRGSVMFVMGGGVKGGRVFGSWPGLKTDVLEGPGDLPVFNNYRNVLAPVLERYGAGDQMAMIFPEFTVEPLSLYSA